MVVVIASLSFGQLAVALSGTVPPKSTAHLVAATEPGGITDERQGQMFQHCATCPEGV
jgi:hypothetical protein